MTDVISYQVYLIFSATQRIQDGAKIVTDGANVIRDSVLSKEQEEAETGKKDEF